MYQALTLSAGTHTVTVRCLDSDIETSSPEVVRTFTVLPPPFETITANETPVKASHIQTLRTTVNMARGYYNLTLAVWSEEIVAGKTTVKNWPFHITEPLKQSASDGLRDSVVFMNPKKKKMSSILLPSGSAKEQKNSTTHLGRRNTPTV